MEILSLLAGVVIGFVLGSGAIVFYMRWKMTRQLNAMQQNMEGMFDMTEEMMGDVDMDSADFEEVEEEKED